MTTFAERLEANMAPWASADLDRYLRAISSMFQPVATLAQEEGTDGELLLPANPVLNPSFEYGIGAAAATIHFNNPGATLSRSTARSFSGVASLLVVTSEAFTAEGVELNVAGPFLEGVTPREVGRV